MSDLGYWTKTAKLDKGLLGTALAATMGGKKQQKLAVVGLLTVGSSSALGRANDNAARKLKNVIGQMNSFQVLVKIQKIIPANLDVVQQTLRDWSDNLDLNLLITTGGSGVTRNDVTPEATKAVIEREVPGMSVAMTMAGLKIDLNSMLFRGICGIRKNVLIINLPGDLQRASDYLNLLLPSVPVAISLLKNSVDDLNESVQPRSRAQSTVSIAESVNARSGEPPSLTNQHSTVLIDSTQQGHHSQPVPAASLTDSAISSSHHLPTHHLDTTQQTYHDITERHHDITVGYMTELTEDDLLGGGTMDTLLSQESLRIVGERPEAQTDETSITGLGSIFDADKIARRPRFSRYAQVSVDKGFAAVFAQTEPLPVTTKSYKDACGHILAEGICASLPVPANPTSVLDGYAVIATDTPGDLEVIKGDSRSVLTLGKTVRVTTGAVMPLGANAVVPVEETVVLKESNDGTTEIAVRCLAPATPGQHMRTKGSDIRAGTTLVKSGTKLGHLEIGLLASVGVTIMPVRQIPKVAIISFGSKLKEPDSGDIRPGDIPDTNRITFLLALQRKGFKVIDMGIVNGDKKQLKERLISAYAKADVVVTTGGVAMGENDCIKPLLQEIGATLHFGRVIMKPGAPTAFATLETQFGKKLFFALSGVPVPAYVAYYIFLLPCLQRMSGMSNPRSKIIKVRLSSDVYLDAVPEYQRAVLRNEDDDPVPWADVTGHQIISRMLSMISVDALLPLPAKSDTCLSIKRGEIVNALLIG